MKILIAGGAGFIGSNLCQLHLEKNDTVHVIDSLITGKKNNILPFLDNKNFQFSEADIIKFDFSRLGRYDVIYHLASPASPIQYKKHPLETLLTNSLGTYNLLEFCRLSKSSIFVLASTSEVYGDPLVHPQPETYWGNVNPNGIRSCYDEGKRFAESLTMTYFRKYNLNIRIARIFNTYGPNMEMNDGRIISNFIVQALTNKPLTIYGSGNQTRSFCFVSDLIKGLYLLANTDDADGKIINLGNQIEKTVLQMANFIKELTNSASTIIFHKIDDDDPQRRKPDISKAKKILNWEPRVDLKEGLEKTISYFKTQI